MPRSRSRPTFQLFDDQSRLFVATGVKFRPICALQ